MEKHIVKFILNGDPVEVMTADNVTPPCASDQSRSSSVARTWKRYVPAGRFV